MKRFVSLAAVIVGAFLLLDRSASAQTAGRFSATRAELDTLAARAEAAASGNGDARSDRLREAAAIRARLRDGDFEVGDHVAVLVRGDTALTDTFTVEPGRTLALPNIPTISLVGVLRSELQPHLAKALADFVKDTVIRAEALVQVGVVGEVTRPGYYLLAMDVPISDAIMAAGGLTTRADVLKTHVRRGTRQVLSREDVRGAIVARRTLETVGLAPGDEIVVGSRREWGWQTIASLLTGAVALAISVSNR